LSTSTRRDRNRMALQGDLPRGPRAGYPKPDRWSTVRGYRQLSDQHDAVPVIRPERSWELLQGQSRRLPPVAPTWPASTSRGLPVFNAGCTISPFADADDTWGASWNRSWVGPRKKSTAGARFVIDPAGIRSRPSASGNFLTGPPATSACRSSPRSF
jgi:hypothetical protein